MKKVFALGLFLFICAQSQAQIIVNSDGTHSIQHGMHAVNSDGTVSAIHGNHLIHSNGTVSVIHGSTIINPDGTVGIQHGKALLNDNAAVANDFFNKKNSKESIRKTKFQKKQEILYRGRVINLSSHFDRLDDQRKSKKEEKKLEKLRRKEAKMRK